jgi:hypothetical protein
MLRRPCGFLEAAMVRRAENLDDVLAQRQRGRCARFLDGLDASIMYVVRGVWQAFIDGLAASAVAQCVPVVDPCFNPIVERQNEQEPIPAIEHSYPAFDEVDLAGDFDDINDLIASVRAMRA